MVLHGQIIKQGIKILSRYYALEGKAFNRLYTGFPQSKTIGRGVRHGLTAGSITGSLINPADELSGNGISQKPTGYKQTQKRGGPIRYPSRNYKYRTRQYNNRCRPSRPSIRRRSYHR